MIETTEITETSDVEELNEKNIGMRFLYNPDQVQSSAVLFLQWCLAPQMVQYLKERRVVNARVFATVHSPRGKGTRFVFPLSSTQELIEFHCPGKHEISGTIVWSNKDSMDKVAENFLVKSERHRYKYEVSQVIQGGNGCHSFGEAELSVTVADGFFAPKLSPFEDWYLNLWFSEAAWDECEISHRRWIAYSIQTVLLGLWIPFIFVIRLAVALWYGVVCLRKGVPWEAVIHPFDWDTDRLWKHSGGRWKEDSFMQLLVPFNHLSLIGVAFVCSIVLGWFTEHPGWQLLAWCMALVYGVSAAAILMVTFLLPLIPEDTKNQWWQNAAERKEQLKTERLEKIYSDVQLCTTALADGTLPTKKRRGFKSYAVLTYHNLKVASCRPTARR